MISVIATVLNEGDNIHHLMQGLTMQTRQPDEIVIVDGGSYDETVTIMQSYSDQLPLRILAEAGCNISQGRNRAIREAKGDIIAVVDAGVRLEPDWLAIVTQVLLDDADVTVVAGFFQADPGNTFEAAMGATVLPLVDEIQPETFLPSSRSVAFRKQAALDVAGYPEWLDYCEDLIFDLRLKAVNPPFVFAPDALVHFRPRRSLKAFFKQYYLYARGDGKADLWRKRHIIRYVTYLVGLPLILAAGVVIHPIFWLALLVGGAVYLRQPYRRLATVMQRVPYRQTPIHWLYALLLVPVIRIVGDIAKMFGYPVGWRWRLQHNPPEWRLARDS